MIAFQGASSNRLQGSWLGDATDPNDDWINDAGELATRAGDLVRNDSASTALLNAKTAGEQGSRGLVFRSLVSLDGKDEETSARETALRQQIEAEIADASEGTQLDANGLYSRRELESALSELSATGGEAWGVRAWIPDRPQATISTCWRLLRRDRVRNPNGEMDSDTLYQGLIFSPKGVQGVHVGPPLRLFGREGDGKWSKVSWYDANGVPQVIHRIGKRMPGSFRGVSMFSPNIYLAKQIKALIDAYVVGKRIQACHPIFIKCADPNAAAKKDRNGVVWGPNTTLEPGKIYYVGEDAEMFFPAWAFNGQDMQVFLDTLYRNQYAAWGLPIDVVLAQLGKTNMAASRSAWLQYYRQCERWQDDHIEQASRIIDMNIIQEAVLLGRIILPTGMTLRQLMKGRYIRPPRAMPDPKKEAEGVKAWVDLGRDLSGLYGESGVDFRESITQRQEDDRWMAEHDVKLASAAVAFGVPSAGSAADPESEAEGASTDPADQSETVDETTTQKETADASAPG